MLDDLLDLLRVLFYLLAFAVFMMALPFVICHVAEHWDDPIYPHSGFSPECPTWKEPENTLPPTDVQSTQPLAAPQRVHGKTPCRLQMCNPPAAQMTCDSAP